MTALRDTLVAAGDTVLLRETSGAALSGGELAANVDALAGALVERGLAGARIGLWHSNSIAAVESTLAVEWLGGTRIPVDPNATAAEAMATWQAAGAGAWITDREHAAQLDERALVHDDDQRLSGSPVPPREDVDPETTILLYPRGVQHGKLLAIPFSYRNWDEIMRVNCGLYRDGTYGPGFDPDTEVFLTAQQIMHGTALGGTFPFLRMGLPQLIMRRFSAGEVVGIFEAGQATAVTMPTLMLERFAETIDSSGRGIGSLRRILYGGAPIPPHRLRRICRALPGILVQMYGRMEGGWPLAILSPEDHGQIAAGDEDLASSCGRPLAAAGEMIIRPSGEIAVRSGMAVREFTDPDGWCGLGDLGEVKNGYLYLKGRLDRQINTGYHIYPGEIEEALRALPSVADAYVCGEPDARFGEKVVAYVVTTESEQTPGGNETLIEQLDEALRRRLASYKVPRVYRLVAQLPKEAMPG